MEKNTYKLRKNKVINLTKKDLLNKLNILKKGFPTDLIYINREIDNNHVQVPDEYNVSNIDEFLEKDIQSVLSLNSIIRPILGMFGSGKSTILNRIETILPLNIPDEKIILIRINMQDIPILKQDEFVKGLMKQIFPILETKMFKEMFNNFGAEDLIDIFKGVRIQRNIKNLYSKDETDRINSKFYFYDNVGEEMIFQLIEGIIQLTIKCGKIIIILIDELESIIETDKEGVITEILVSRFLRGIIERYNSSVYIAFTCYKEAYDSLKENFYKFYRIVEGSEIKLSGLSDNEKLELTQQILDVGIEYTFGKLKANDILNKIKGMIESYMGNVVKLIVREVFQCIDQFKAITDDIHNLYESNARKQSAVPHLQKLGFKPKHIADEPMEIAGYNFDIFANMTDRNKVIKRAFGEIKSVTCNKRLAEDFTNWINNQILNLSLEYKRDRDYLLFIAPDYTTEATTLLEDHQVKWLTYYDVAVEKILKDIEEERVKDLNRDEKSVILFINETKSKCRTYKKMIGIYKKELLENLAKKGKIEIKIKGKTKYICIKK